MNTKLAHCKKCGVLIEGIIYPVGKDTFCSPGHAASDGDFSTPTGSPNVEALEKALYAIVPGGAPVWAFLPQQDAFTPHQTARDVLARAIEAYLAALPKGVGLDIGALVDEFEEAVRRSAQATGVYTKHADRNLDETRIKLIAALSPSVRGDEDRAERALAYIEANLKDIERQVEVCKDYARGEIPNAKTAIPGTATEISLSHIPNYVAEVRRHLAALSKSPDSKRAGEPHYIGGYEAERYERGERPDGAPSTEQPSPPDGETK